MKYFLYNIETKQGVTKAVDGYSKLMTIRKQLEDTGTNVEIAGIIMKDGKVTGIDPDYAIPMEPEYRLEPKKPIFDPPPPIKHRRKFTKIVIKYPIWKEPRSVGINHNSITDDIQLEISYRNKDGRLLYPDPFFMDKNKALSYPIQEMKSNKKIKLHIIPLNDFVVNVRDLDRILEAP